MKSVPKRLLIWTTSVLVIAAAVVVLRYCVERRDDWLVRAAWRGDISKVRMYLSLGAGINSRIGGDTALHAAAYNGDVTLLDFLLASGAAVDSKAKFDITPLWYARQNKQTDAEKLLLAHGANPDTSRINPP